MTTCRECGRKYEFDRRKGHQKHICNSCNVTLHRHKRKAILIDLLGGECSRCGYDKCAEALHFHHRQSGEPKSFGISDALCRRSLGDLKAEAAKCDLVCSNCHAEIHTTGRTDDALQRLRAARETARSSNG